MTIEISYFNIHNISVFTVFYINVALNTRHFFQKQYKKILPILNFWTVVYLQKNYNLLIWN